MLVCCYLAAISQTVVKGKHPHGLACKFLNILEEKYKPSDASAKVSLMSELRAIPFKMANDYYNDVVGVTAKYDLQLSETSLIEYLTEKVRDTSIAKIIVDHLEKPSGSHDLEALCKDISKVQCVAKICRGKNTNVKPDKEVNLTSTEGGESRKVHRRKSLVAVVVKQTSHAVIVVNVDMLRIPVGISFLIRPLHGSVRKAKSVNLQMLKLKLPFSCKSRVPSRWGVQSVFLLVHSRKSFSCL